MLKNLSGFVQERLGSVVSKKVGAAVVGGSAAMGAEGPAQDAAVLITIAYIIGQAIVDAAKARWSE
tara:strand:- start:69 stop:266 length:198 start_codon:yes stop_codon:yes gene_type:complete